MRRRRIPSKAKNPIRGVRPEFFRYSKGLALAGSALISSPKEAEWLARHRFNTIISFEPLSEPIKAAFVKFGVKCVSFPVLDADEGPYFSSLQRERLRKIVLSEWRAKRKVLVHCLEGKGRTGEALKFLSDAAMDFAHNKKG